MERVFGQTTGRKEGCHKRKGGRFLISQHIRPCYGSMQPMGNPDAALKRRNQTNLPLGQKVRVLVQLPSLRSAAGWCLSGAQMLHQHWNHL